MIVIDFDAICLKNRCKTFLLMIIIDFYAIYLRGKVQKLSIHDNN